MANYAKLTIDLEPKFLTRLQTFAKKNSTSVRQTIIQAVEAWMKTAQAAQAVRHAPAAEPSKHDPSPQ